MSFTETIAAGRAFADQDDPPIDANRELVATGVANSEAPARRDAGRRRDIADGGRAGRRRAVQTASLVTAGNAAATMLLLAPLLGLLPQATLAAVVIVYSVGLIQLAEFPAIRRVRTMEFRWAVAAHRRAGVRDVEGHRGRNRRSRSWGSRSRAPTRG